MTDQTTAPTVQRAYETGIRKVPRRTWWLPHWAWYVTRYALTDPVSPGVYDGRMHLWSDSGYAYTKLGAALAVAGEITEEATDAT